MEYRKSISLPMAYKRPLQRPEPNTASDSRLFWKAQVEKDEPFMDSKGLTAETKVKTQEIFTEMPSNSGILFKTWYGTPIKLSKIYRKEIFQINETTFKGHKIKAELEPQSVFAELIPKSFKKWLIKVKNPKWLKIFK